MRFIPSDVLFGFSDGQLARGCGIVTVRQRPETAKGVIFITIEDEAGTVNVICWSSLVEQFRREVMGAQLLGVYGVWQCESNVRHLVAKRLVGVSVFLCAGPRRLFHGAARRPMRRARACGAVVKSVRILPDHSRESIVK
jgi:error-prone DNA polymerase